jgi:hypothetical protein
VSKSTDPKDGAFLAFASVSLERSEDSDSGTKERRNYLFRKVVGDGESPFSKSLHVRGESSKFGNGH